MANIIKYAKLLMRKGLKADLSTLDEAELGLATDTKEVFVGANGGNVQLAKQTEVESVKGDISTLQEDVSGNVDKIGILQTSVNDNTTKLVKTINKVNNTVALFEAEEGTDITTALNNLIGTGNKYIKIQNGTFLIDASVGIVMQNNTTLEFSPNTVIKVIANNLESYNAIRIANVTNVKVINPRIIGDRYEHLGTTGEWGNGIHLRGAKNVEIINPEVSNCWGDGIYISEMVVEKIPSENIVIRNPICDNNRRQGISVVSVKGLLIENPILKNTKGTAPATGMDIEPNYNHNLLQNIRITNLYTENNDGVGLYLCLDKLSGSTESVNITIDGFKDVGSFRGFWVTQCKGSLTGNIAINDISVSLNKSVGIEVRNYSVNFPHIKMRSIQVINPNTNQYTSTKYGSGIVVFTETGETNTNDVGNVTMDGIWVEDNRTTKLIVDAIYVLNNAAIGSGVMENVNLYNLLRLDSSTGVSMVQFYAKGVIEDRLSLLKVAISTTSLTYSRYAIKQHFTNTGSTTTRTLTLPDTVHNDAPKITVEITDSYPLRIIPTNACIYPLSTIAGKYITSSAIGSRVELKKSNGHWKIVNLIGSWTVEP